MVYSESLAKKLLQDSTHKTSKLSPVWFALVHCLPFICYAGSAIRMSSASILLGNGRSISAKRVWPLTSQKQKEEIQNPLRSSNFSCTNKSFTSATRCRWPLLLYIRRCSKEQRCGLSGLNSPVVVGSLVQTGFALTVGSEEKATPLEDGISGGPDRASVTGEYFGKAVDKTELEALRVNAIRSNLIRKLSEANQYNRHLKRQIHDKEKTLNKCKNELALMEMELQALVAIAEEAAKDGANTRSRKINGRYPHSHLAIRLEELRDKLLEQIKDVDTMQFREVPLLWFGMAEDVKIMGSFDGWTYGEHMSPESGASFTRFSTTLKLRPGRYEIKFLVDGEWHVSPEFPVVGEGLMANNLLVVE